MLAFVTCAAWLLAVASSHPLLRPRASCPSLGSGTINIASYQLYPENVDFDEQSCLLCKFYIGALYNASVVVYDPYKGSVVSTIEFPNITRTVPFHIGGVAWDRYAKNGRNKPADEITILVDAAQAHETAGRDVSGDNYIIRWDAAAQRVLWTANLTAVSRGRYGGPQDVEHDADGNVYVLGTYPGTLLRIRPGSSNSSSGSGSGSGGSSRAVVVEEWYVPRRGGGGGGNATAPPPLDHAVVGFTGFAAMADGSALLVTDARNRSADGGALYRFDTAARRGDPVRVPIAYPGGDGNANATTVFRPGDAIYLPPRYGDAVLLVTEHDAGVSVLRSGARRRGGGGGGGGGNGDGSDDKWRAADFLGRIPNPPDVAASGGVVTSAVEIGGRVFMVPEWFTDPLVPGTSAGKRASFPLVDITAQVDALVRPR
ncbi:hypothetical protein F4802DRAFT_617263 [Xylaria palmicola]|nr:hypothetical protein F4802DRAFT_617263 [Xylaria palmicola]